MNKTLLSRLHTAAAAGLNSTEFSLNFHPVSVLRWELEIWEGRGGGGLCSKGPAIEDLMALSVQSLVGSLTGYRCMLRDGFIPNESELEQSCTQSSNCPRFSVCLPLPAPPSSSRSRAHSALRDVPAHSSGVTVMCFSGGMRILQVNTWRLKNHPPKAGDRGCAVARDC